MQHLMNFDLSLINVFSAPKTEALLEQKERSFVPHQAWWLSTLDQGFIRYTYDMDGRETIAQTAGWPSEEMVRQRLWTALALWHREHKISQRVLPAQHLWAWFNKHSLLPDLGVRQEGDGARNRYITLPALDTCREAFDAMTGQTRKWE